MPLAKVVYLKNEELQTIKPGFMGAPYMRGRFRGEFESRSGKSMEKSKGIIRFLRKIGQKEEIVQSSTLPIIKDKSFLKKRENFIVWLGHASFLIQLDGKRILTDPCFGSSLLLKRHTPAPFHIRELGSIDYLLVSHGHKDHLDLAAVRSAGALIKEALVPLKMGRLIKRANPGIKVQEAGWYQQYKSDCLEIYLLPAHHWHRRTPFDFNRILWGSYIIRSGTKTIYFAGDSGYNVHFKEIGQLFSPIDYAIMPINPPYVIEGSHMTHTQTFEAIVDLGARKVIPMHYGTFKLTLESVDELLEWFKSLENHEQTKGKTMMVDIGDVMEI